MFAEVQGSFAGALLDAGRPVPSGVLSHNATTPAKRFAVYRNNVVVGLVGAVKSRFPVVERIVGDGAVYSQPFSEGGAAAAGGVAFGTEAKPVDGGFLAM